MTVETPRPFEVKTDDTTQVSEETKAIIDRNLPLESEEVKEKFGELIDAIKCQATREIAAVEDLSRETYGGQSKMLEKHLIGLKLSCRPQKKH